MGKLNGKTLSGLLEKVYLGGMINECLLTIEGGQASITALDYTHTVRLHVEAPIESDDLKIGLPSLSTVMKVISRHDELDYKVKDQNLIMLLPGGEKITLLTLDVDHVPTSPEKEFDLKGSLKKATGVKFECPLTMLEKLNEYRGLLSTKTVSFWTKGKYINMGSMSTRERKFTVPKIAELDKEPDEDIMKEFMSEHVESVLKGAKDDKELTVIHLLADDKAPLIVTCGNNWWTIQALVE